jgi:Ca2+-binding RTX toxin-like protein
VRKVEIDLAGTLGGGAGDNAVDTVTINGTQAVDTIVAATQNGIINVTGLPAAVSIAHFEPTDSLTINGLGGNDTINASGLQGIELTINGGLGIDTIIGSSGDDLVNGGDDTFVWNPGDDNDTVEGQGGFDTLLFNGANVAENIDISANGGRATFFRNVANVTMDLNDVEKIDFRALGGADNIVVNDLAGTDVTNVSLDLAGTLGGTTADGQADTITINATNGDDVIQIFGDASGIRVLGLGSEFDVLHFDAFDRLVINGLGGDDVIEASGLDGIQLVADGGAGNDVLIGSAGNDILSGGLGDDVLIGGLGVDILDGGPGDNVLIV